MAQAICSTSILMEGCNGARAVISPLEECQGEAYFLQSDEDGDWEGCLHLDRLPTADEAVVIREVLGMRKRRHMTAEALSKLERTRGLIKSPNLAPHSAPEEPLPVIAEPLMRHLFD